MMGRGRPWFILSGLFGAMGVIGGAAAAHVGGSTLVAIGAQYQQIHALALLGVGLAAWSVESRLIALAGVAFATGCALFGGGLYLEAAGLGWVGPAVPIGGAAFILGWLLLGVGGAVASARRRAAAS